MRRATVLGISTTEICGVRDHATLLAEELRRRGTACEMRWLQRRASGWRQERAEVAAYARELRTALAAERPDVAILHYSVFSFSHRGLPLYVRVPAAALRAAGVPVVTVVHEAVYPWTIGGPRGKVWALSQRAALVEVVRSSSALLLTADFRADWFASRPWLPRRPIAVAPVYSNLPPPSPGARDAAEADTIGLFGFSYEGADSATVLDALADLRRGRRPQARLRLLGAPGPDSPAARSWSEQARARGVDQAISFSGMLAPQQLSDVLARCAVLLFAGAGGPSSRKGSLAGSLASGSPVVALDGPRTWRELRDGETIRIVSRNAVALAGALAELLDDEATREAIGARGRRFAEHEMGVGRTVEALEQLLGGAQDASAPRSLASHSPRARS